MNQASTPVFVPAAGPFAGNLRLVSTDRAVRLAFPAKELSYNPKPGESGIALGMVLGGALADAHRQIPTVVPQGSNVNVVRAIRHSARDKLFEMVYFADSSQTLLVSQFTDTRIGSIDRHLGLIAVQRAEPDQAPKIYVLDSIIEADSLSTLFERHPTAGKSL